MTQYYFDKHFATAKVVKTGSIEIGGIGSTIWGIYELTDSGHILLTWKDQSDIERYCDISTECYYQLLNN